MMDKKFIGESVGGGIAITLLSYFFNSTPGGGLVGATWYGFPLTWIRYLAVGPQYNPWAVDIVGLIADIVIWSVIVAIVLLTFKKMKKSK